MCWNACLPERKRIKAITIKYICTDNKPLLKSDLLQIFCGLRPHCRGPISQWWSVDKDISRSFATKRKLRQKGGGGPVWKHMICWVGSQFDILCDFSFSQFDISYDFTFYHFSFLVLIARPCCWIHVSFRCNICPDRNLDVSALFKNSNAHNFLCEWECSSLWCSEIWFQNKILPQSTSNGFQGKIWISQMLRFELIWGLRGGARLRLIYCVQFFSPTQSDRTATYFVILCFCLCVCICVCLCLCGRLRLIYCIHFPLNTIW